MSSDIKKIACITGKVKLFFLNKNKVIKLLTKNIFVLYLTKQKEN